MAAIKGFKESMTMTFRAPIYRNPSIHVQSPIIMPIVEDTNKYFTSSLTNGCCNFWRMLSFAISVIKTVAGVVLSPLFDDDDDDDDDDAGIRWMTRIISKNQIAVILHLNIFNENADPVQ